MLSFISKIIDRTLVIAGALIFSQAPVFMLQYHQMLVGHVNELNIQVNAIKTNALQVNKPLETYIDKFLNNSDIDFRLQGELMQSTVERWHVLNDGLVSLQNASLWERPFIFFKYLNWNIATSTLNNYKINLPLTVEGGIYAFLGMLIGYAFFLLIRQFFRFLSRPFTKRVANPKASEE